MKTEDVETYLGMHVSIDHVAIKCLPAIISMFKAQAKGLV